MPAIDMALSGGRSRCASQMLKPTAKAMSRPKTARNQKIHGHGPTARIQPPTIGATAGATAKIMTI